MTVVQFKAQTEMFLQHHVCIYGAGEGWRRSVGLVKYKMKCYRLKEGRNILLNNKQADD
jgi:hypothetical protein